MQMLRDEDVGVWVWERGGVRLFVCLVMLGWDWWIKRIHYRIPSSIPTP